MEKTTRKNPKKWLECCTCGCKITAKNFWSHKHGGYQSPKSKESKE